VAFVVTGNPTTRWLGCWLIDVKAQPLIRCRSTPTCAQYASYRDRWSNAATYLCRYAYQKRHQQLADVDPLGNRHLLFQHGQCLPGRGSLVCTYLQRLVAAGARVDADRCLPGSHAQACRLAHLPNAFELKSARHNPWVTYRQTSWLYRSWAIPPMMV